MSLVLAIEADATAFRRVLGELRTEARSTANVLAGEFKRSGAETEKAHKGAARAAGRAAAEAEAAAKKASAAEEREAKNRAKIAEREEKAKSKLAALRLREAEKTEAEITRFQEREAEKRERLQERRAAAGRRREAREARERARAAETEAREIAQLVSRYEGRGRALGGQLFGAAQGYGRQIAGDIRGERARTGSTERSMGLALYQAGGRRSDVVRATRRVQQFAIDNPGLDSQELAGGINAAQTEFNVLSSNALGRTRDERMGRLLDVGRLAFNTGNNTGEFMRMEGLFAQSGLDTSTRDTLLRYTAGAAQRGAVEAGTVTRQAMPAITARVGDAIATARRTGADPQAAAREAYAQSLAELEVARSAGGESPRAAGNALRDVSRSLRSTQTQERLLTNIGSSQLTRQQREQLTSTLFEADPTRRGHQRLRGQYTNALNLMTAFGQAGISADEFNNLTRGGGHGNPMSMLSNQRRVLGSLLNPNAEGRAGWQNVQELMNVQGTALTADDVARGAGVFGQDAEALAQQRQEQRGAALTDNTNAIVRLVEKIDGIAAAHPFLAPALGAGAGVAGRWLFGQAGALLGQAGALLGLGGEGAAGAGAAGATAGGAAATGVAGLGAAGIAGVALGGAALVGGTVANGYAALTGRSATGRQLGTAERVGRGVAVGVGPVGSLLGAGDLVSSAGARTGQSMQGISLGDLVRAVSDGVTQGIQQSGGVPVRQDPLDRAAAGARGASGSTPPAP